MTAKVGDTYRFEGVVEHVRSDDASAYVALVGDQFRTILSANALAAATLIEKPYEPAVGDVVAWGTTSPHAMQIIGVDGIEVWLKTLHGNRFSAGVKELRRLPPETPLGPIAASQEGER